MTIKTTIEWGLVVVVMMVALLPLLVAAVRSRKWSRIIIYTALWLIAPAVFSWMALGLRVKPILEADVTNRPIEVVTQGYVTSDRCESCHPSQYATWHRSYHRTMTQAATPEAILGDFSDVHLEWQGISYDLSVDDEGAWVESHDPIDPGAEPVKRKVVMLTGSHLDQVYWLDGGRGDRILIPFQFHHSNRLDRWIPTISSYLADPKDSDVAFQRGDWNARCIRCHSGGGAMRLTRNVEAGRGSFDTQVVELGIACESCHGPAEEHVRVNRNPINRFAQYFSDSPDPTIANPKLLDNKRSSRICGQCHSVSLLSTESDTAKHVGFELDPYRPGMTGPDPRTFVRHRYADPDYPARPDEVETHKAVLEIIKNEPDLFENAFWSDGMVRVSGRDYSGMIESPCFERGEIGCMSCHVLHQTPEDERTIDEWAHHQMKPEMYGNRACIQCHEDFELEDRLLAHTRHALGSSGSQCYSCHMPYTTYGMLKGVRSHQISSPSAQESISVGRPNACNLCHLDRPLAWAADRLEDWYDIPAPELSADQTTIAAGVLWALTGRAGVRAITAYSMGLPEAGEASGTNWMTPILSQLLADPYFAVRYIASTALKKREAYTDFEYDFVVDGSKQQDALFRARMLWPGSGRGRTESANLAVLRNEDSEFLATEMRKLVQRRDDTPVFLAE